MSARWQVRPDLTRDGGWIIIDTRDGNPYNNYGRATGYWNSRSEADAYAATLNAGCSGLGGPDSCGWG